MNRASDRPPRPPVGRARPRGKGGARTLLAEQGQSLAELVIVMPILLILVFGIVEVGRLLETQHTMSSLTREGANLASRGESMTLALEATRENQEAAGLGTEGGVVISRLVVDDDGVPLVNAQETTPGYENASRLGSVESAAKPYVDIEPPLLEQHTYYVVEIFMPYHPITPFANLVDNLVPEGLYDRTLF